MADIPDIFLGMPYLFIFFCVCVCVGGGGGGGRGGVVNIKCWGKAYGAD